MLLNQPEHTLVCLVAAARSPKKIIIVPEALLLGIEQKDVNTILQHLEERNKTIFIYYDRRKHYHDIFDNVYGATVIAILSSSGQVLAYGTPEEMRERRLRNRLRSRIRNEKLYRKNPDVDENDSDELM